MIILAFGHRKRVGKDTAAKFALQYLKTNYPKITTCRLSFGDQVKIVSERMFKWAGLKDAIYYENHPELKEEVLPLCGKSPRQIWIDVGNMARHICPTVWVRMAIQDCKAGIAVCPDLRDPSETRLISDVGGFRVRIDRDSAPKSDDPIDSALAALDTWDAVISNNGTLRELNANVIIVTDQLVKKYF